MAIREDIEKFPFEDRKRMTWYFLIDWSEKKIMDFYNVSGKEQVVQKLEEIISKGETERYELYGIWHGQWRTDIFKIPIELAYKKLYKYFYS